MTKIENIKKLMLIGLIGGIFSCMGDFLLSFNTYPEAENVYFALLASCKDLSYTRLALSALCGGIGIPLQYFGLEAFSKIITARLERSGKIIRIGAIATALFGGTVHVLCVLFMLMVKMECLNGFSPLDSETIIGMFPESTIPFMLYAVMPLSMLCMMPYFVATLVIFVSIIKKHTPFPRWFAVLSPVVFVAVLQLIAIIFVPNNPIFNGMNMANKALGAVVLFGAALIWLCGNKTK